jgi:hypothetical protein
MFPGSGRKPEFMLQHMNNCATFRLIRAKKELVVNSPTYDLKQRFMKQLN